MFIIVLSLLFLSFVWHSHWAEFLLHLGSSEKTCEFQKIMYSSCLEGIQKLAASKGSPLICRASLAYNLDGVEKTVYYRSSQNYKQSLAGWLLSNSVDFSLFIIFIQKQDPTQFLRVYGQKYKIHIDPQLSSAGDGKTVMWEWMIIKLLANTDFFGGREAISNNQK